MALFLVAVPFPLVLPVHWLVLTAGYLVLARYARLAGLAPLLLLLVLVVTGLAAGGVGVQGTGLSTPGFMDGGGGATMVLVASPSSLALMVALGWQALPRGLTVGALVAFLLVPVAWVAAEDDALIGLALLAGVVFTIAALASVAWQALRGSDPGSTSAY